MAVRGPEQEPRLDKFQAQLAADNGRRALQCRQRDVSVLRIEQPADLAAAGSHPLGQALTRNVVALHRLAELPRQYFLDGNGFEFLELSFLLEEVVERGELRRGTSRLLADFLFHAVLTRFRIRACAAAPR